VVPARKPILKVFAAGCAVAGTAVAGAEVAGAEVAATWVAGTAVVAAGVPQEVDSKAKTNATLKTIRVCFLNIFFSFWVIWEIVTTCLSLIQDGRRNIYQFFPPPFNQTGTFA
jgi:hypothetical protein